MFERKIAPRLARLYRSWSVVYQQIFGGRSGNEYYTDSINFRYKATAPSSTAADIESYVHRHNMRFEPELARTHFAPIGIPRLYLP
jgi:hypothetical protein